MAGRRKKAVHRGKKVLRSSCLVYAMIGRKNAIDQRKKSIEKLSFVQFWVADKREKAVYLLKVQK